MHNTTAMTALLQAVHPFFPKAQLTTLMYEITNMDAADEDAASHRQYVIGILQKFKTTIEQMPSTYETEHIDTPEKIAHLHYFYGEWDWWVVEKDGGMENEIDKKQLQAYGVTKLGNNKPELGYISIDELVHLQAISPSGIPITIELDFYWEPTPLKDIPAIAPLLDHKA